MAYCRNCGAYIPDGQTVCVACGADSSAAAGSSAAQTASREQYSSSEPSSDDFRRQLEEKQRKQREQSREWAKQAYEKYKSSSSHSTSSSTGSRPYSEEKSGRTLGKVLAFLSYISVGCFLPFIITPEDEFAKFHGKQGILLFVLSIIIDILGGLRSIAFVLGVVRLYLMFVGIKNVLCDKMEKLPFIGKYADKF